MHTGHQNSPAVDRQAVAADAQNFSRSENFTPRAAASASASANFPLLPEHHAVQQDQKPALVRHLPDKAQPRAARDQGVGASGELEQLPLDPLWLFKARLGDAAAAGVARDDALGLG
jgi:hypothetical protein